MSEKERDELRAQLAHELQTPLAVIVGYGELIATRGDERARLEASRMILEAAERLSRGIEDLLDRLDD